MPNSLNSSQSMSDSDDVEVIEVLSKCSQLYGGCFKDRFQVIITFLEGSLFV